MNDERDPIPFAQYEADTRQLAEAGAHIASELMRERRKADVRFWTLVIAAGGEITVPRSLMQRIGPDAEIEWEMWQNPADDSTTYRARIK